MVWKRLPGTMAIAALVILLTGCVALTAPPTYSPPTYSPQTFSPPATSTPTPTPTSTATPTPTSPPTPDPVHTPEGAVCARADELTAKGEPDQALALIAAYRKADVRKPELVTAESVCEPERIAALQAQSQLANGASLGTPSSTFAVQWSQFVASWISPFTEVYAVAGVTLLVLLVIARLLVFLPWFSWLLPRSRWTRRVVGVIGFVAMVGLAGVLPLVLAAFAPSALIVWGLVAAVAAAMFGIATASRLRLVIDVQDDDDTSSASRLVALISELGAAPPKGMEMPFGSDVTALKDVGLSVPGDNGFINALKWLANSLFTATPWRVAIAKPLTTGDPPAESGPLTVVITRNSRSHSSYVISGPSILPVKGEDAKDVLHPYLLEFAAAAIVVTLARHNTGFDGLCGATDWRSVGLQYVATTRLANDKAAQQPLLVRALDLDPRNLLAEVALKNVLYRDTTDPASEEIGDYIAWLNTESDSLLRSPSSGRVRPGYQAVHRRMQLSALALTLNRDWVKNSVADDDTKQRAQDLLHDLEDPPKWSSRANPLAKQQQLSAALFSATAEQKPPTNAPYTSWYQDAIGAYSPKVALNAACYFCTVSRKALERRPRGATDAEMNETKAAIATVTDRLRIVALNPDVVAKAPKDPVLKTFADTEWFRRAVS